MNNQWKLVPVEPTETMVINGFESVPNECFTDEEVWEQYQEMSGCQQAAFRAKLCWVAMLSSAPVPPADGEVEVRTFYAREIDLDDGFIECVLAVDHRAHVTLLQAEVSEWKRQADYNQETSLRWLAERDALQERLNAADQRIDDLEAELGPTFDEVRAKNKAVAESLEPGTGRCTFDVLWKSGGSAVDATITEEQYSKILKILNRDVAILSTAFRGAVSQ